MQIPKYKDLLPSLSNKLFFIFPFIVIPKNMPQANSNIRPKKVELNVKILLLKKPAKGINEKRKVISKPIP